MNKYELQYWYNNQCFKKEEVEWDCSDNEYLLFPNSISCPNYHIRAVKL